MPPLSGPRAVQVSRTLKHLVPLGWESTVVCFGPRSRALQSGSRSRVAAARAVRRHAGAGASLEERLVLPRAVAPHSRRSSCCRTRNGCGFGAASARRASAVARATLRCARLVRAALVGSSRSAFAFIARPACRGSRTSATRGPTVRICAGTRWQWRIWRRMEAEVIRRADGARLRQRPDRRSGDAQVPGRMAREGPRGAAWVRHGGSDPGVRRRRRPAASGVHRPFLRRHPHTRAVAACACDASPRIGRSHAICASRWSALQSRRTCTLPNAFVSTASSNSPGRLPFLESARIAASADVLLVIDAAAEDNLFLPSKLIDYLPLAKPILGLTPRSRCDRRCASARSASRS